MSATLTPTRSSLSFAVAALLVLATVLVGCAAIPQAQTAPPEGRFVSASVVRVVDGDTAVFRLANGSEEKTRFIGVDTPESTNSIEPYGKEAAVYTSAALMPGTQVLLELDAEERDRYGRLLAYVWLEQPTALTDDEIRAKMFNAHLALDGYAQQMTIQPNSKYADYFTTYVREAREAGKGLWGSDPAAPVQAVPTQTEPERAEPARPEAAAPAETSVAYIGNANSRVFHRPDCSSVGQMSGKNKVPLSSRQDAIARGFRPCGRCSP